MNKRLYEINEEATQYFRRTFSTSIIESFKAGARYADRTLIQKALDWLIEESNNGTIDLRNHMEFEERFIKAMRE